MRANRPAISVEPRGQVAEGVYAVLDHDAAPSPFHVRVQINDDGAVLLRLSSKEPIR